MTVRLWHFLGVGFFLVLASALGWVVKPAPAVPPPSPSNVQLTIAAATLVHGLEQQQGLTLAAPPDYIKCAADKDSLSCDFHVTYLDESSAVWEIVLDKHNVPTIVKRLREAPAPKAS